MSLQTIRNLAAMLATASLLATPVSAQPVPAEPASRWALDYGELSCKLQRSFKAGDAIHLLRFERKPLLKRTTLTVLADVRGPAGDATKTGQIVTDGGKTVSVEISRVPLAQRRPRYSMLVQLEKSELDSVKEHFAIMAGSMIEMRFHTGALETPVAALDQCISDLYTELGIDESRLEDIEEFPAIDFRRLIKQIPEESYDGDRGGRLLGMLQVDATGTITDCALSEPADPNLREEVCASMQEKTRLKPAINKDGQPISAPFFLEFTAVRRGPVIQ